MTTREFALRLVVFEYLLPSMRRSRLAALKEALLTARRVAAGGGEDTRVVRFENLIFLSDRLLAQHGGASSFFYPISRMPEDPRVYGRDNVTALVDARRFPWGRVKRDRRAPCTRLADPADEGFRCHASGASMPLGYL